MSERVFMQALEDLRAATDAALTAAGPQVVIAQVVRQAMQRYSERHGLADAVDVARHARVALGGMVGEAVAANEDLGWEEIGRILGISAQRARAAYGQRPNPRPHPR